MFVRKSTYNALLSDKEKLFKEHEQLQIDYAAVVSENEEVKSELSRHNEYENKTKASFTFSFDDTLEVGTPVGHVKDAQTVNRLVERGYLASNRTKDEFAVQLALLAMVSDFINNMLASFEEPIEDDDNE